MGIHIALSQMAVEAFGIADTIVGLGVGVPHAKDAVVVPNVTARQDDAFASSAEVVGKNWILFVLGPADAIGRRGQALMDVLLAGRGQGGGAGSDPSGRTSARRTVLGRRTHHTDPWDRGHPSRPRPQPSLHGLGIFSMPTVELGKPARPHRLLTSSMKARVSWITSSVIRMCPFFL